MSLESTRAAFTAYMENHDMSKISDEAVFTVMATGQEARGREEIGGLLHYFYKVAFDAAATLTNLVIADGKVAAEFEFAGTHTGDFAGIAATNKMVNVPLCVFYDLEGDLIVRARIYFETDALRMQLG